METRQLKYFLDVANCLNFTKAAQKNHIAQTAMSQNIISLENQLGFKLFERNNRAVKLTHMGELFYSDAVAIIRAVELSEMRMREIARGYEGTIRIGFQGEHESRFLPELIQKYRSKYPRVNISLVQGIAIELERMLEADTTDFIFNIEYQDTAEDVEQWHIESQPLCMVVPKSHKFAHMSSIDRRLMAGEPMVFIDPTCSENIYHYMIHESMKSGFTPNVVAYGNSMHSVMLMVRCGLGITVQPSSCNIGWDDIVVIPLENEEPLSVVARWKKENHNPALATFVDVVKDTFPQA